MGNHAVIASIVEGAGNEAFKHFISFPLTANSDIEVLERSIRFQQGSIADYKATISQLGTESWAKDYMDMVIAQKKKGSQLSAYSGN